MGLAFRETGDTTMGDATNETMPMVKPGEEHRWLHRLLGEWTYEGEALMAPDQPPVRFSGTETVRSMGGLWIVGEGQGAMPGCGPSTTQVLLGFDPQKGRFVGTWVGSMAANLWIYDGSLDEARRVLTLESEGPSFSDPSKTARYRDVIELESDDHRILRSQGPAGDGSWTTFMTAHYRRRR